MAFVSWEIFPPEPDWLQLSDRGIAVAEENLQLKLSASLRRACLL
jgi:hypothetical protein